MSGASPLSGFSVVSAVLVFAIRTPCSYSSASVAFDQRRQLPVRLVPCRPQPLLLLKGGLVAFFLQPGRSRLEGGVQSRPCRQGVDHQNEVSARSFRIGITTG